MIFRRTRLADESLLQKQRSPRHSQKGKSKRKRPGRRPATRRIRRRRSVVHNALPATHPKPSAPPPRTTGTNSISNTSQHPIPSIHEFHHSPASDASAARMPPEPSLFLPPAITHSGSGGPPITIPHPASTPLVNLG
jgi:hypothetical protein